MQNNIAKILQDMNMNPADFKGGNLDVFSPIDGHLMGCVLMDTKETVDAKIAAAHNAFQTWRDVPAPQRGELVRLLGEELRTHKDALSALVTAECGKIFEEGKGEVQEMIDICDFAVGLSRQLHGLTIKSERPGHHMREYWQPLGVVGVISAFNFPVAVWAWNATLALISGDTLVWKPSEKTPMVALACQKILDRAIARFGNAPAGLSSVIIGLKDVGEQMVDDQRVSLVSATGSTRMGREVGPRVAARFGKTILELGGNNAMIIAPSADLDMAVPAIVFGAVGTCGQRCTSTRRVIVHESIYDILVPKIKKAYASLRIGNPLANGTLVGPLIDQLSFNAMEKALADAGAEGGVVTGGGRRIIEGCADGYYVNPAIVEMDSQTASMCEETFAPILYIIKYTNFDHAIVTQNAVPQGLSSAVFTTDVREAEQFVSSVGSDCGIANVNIGTSGAEIGGAFGGEKETGGGRESGSDAWKAYCRRMTSTVNYSREMPLAQGIKFDL